MLTGRSVKWILGFSGVLAAVSGCPADSTGQTEDADTENETATDTDPTGGPQLEPLQGVADLHLHMFAEEAFGGGWFHGSALGPGETALAPCDGGEPGDHGRLKEELAPLLGTCEMPLDELVDLVPLVAAIANGGGGLVSEFVSAVPGSDGDTGAHADRTGGWPELESWPRWDAIAHQQVWEEQLHEAWQAGLRVEVISAVSLNWLCRALPEENLERPQCDEMEDVRLQLRTANDFAAERDWVEVALSAEDARRIVSEGKLAFILSVEASHIMGEGDWRAQLDELYAMGVRTLQPVHQLDNRFGGAAPHNTIFHVAQYAENCHIDYDCGLTTTEVTLGFDVDADCKNTLGLTDEGRALIQEMIDRKMLIDIAHLSEKGVREVYDLSVAADYYPLYISHGHFREIMVADREHEEKTTPAWIAGMLRETGGMFGLRTAHEEVDTYEPSPVDNTCHGSSRSFAQAYDFGRLGLEVSIGLGSDLNGFIQQTRPRFGPDACSASFPVEGRCQARDEREAGPPRLDNGFDEVGLGHIGLLPALLDDLDQLGTDTEPLRTSADDFVRMWERASGERTGPAESIDDLSTEGIVQEPRHTERLAAYPEECGTRYCPDALLADEPCRFDAECVSGVCAGAGDCGNPLGTCE